MGKQKALSTLGYFMLTDSNANSKKRNACGLYGKNSSFGKERRERLQEGFSLIEVTIALVVFLVAVLGVYTTFTYSVNYNAGNISRAQSLAILQQEVETLRSLKFTPGKMDPELKGGVKSPKVITNPSDGNNYRIQTIIDDDPFTPGVQIDDLKTLKEITVTVTLDRPSPGWQTAVPATIVLRRVRGN
jgi:prepilin-type N-terminal cleavage/methylation domain